MSSSDHMKLLADEYRQLLDVELPYLRDEEAEMSSVTMFSSVTSTELSPMRLGSSYWVTNLTSPVRFSSAVTHQLETSSGEVLFLELGPHTALAGPLRQIWTENSHDCSYASARLWFHNGRRKWYNGRPTPSSELERCSVVQAWRRYLFFKVFSETKTMIL